MVKLNKFVAKGAADSPAAFARVAIGSASPAVAAAAFDPSAIAEADARYVRGFFAKPSVETLDALSHARTHLRHDELVYLLREANARPAAFYPFFGMKAEGRFEVGLAAAGQVAELFDYQLADLASEATTLATMLASPDKLVRGNAAFVLGRWHFGAGDRTAATAHYAAGDAVVRDGLLVGLRSAVYAIVKDRVGPRDPAELAPVLLAALRGKASERTLAVKAIEQIAGRGRTDVGWALDGLLEVLDDGKPAQIECALHALGSQAGSIESGRCPYDARIGASIAAIVRHAKPVAGKAKVTKVQIAAKDALADYVDIAEHFDAKQRAALAKATEASQNIR